MNGKVVCLLLYADDLVLISESPEELQEMLNVLDKWCKKWQISINCSKSKIVHYRKQNIEKTNFKFAIDGKPLEIVNRYKYLGIILDEHLDYNVTANVLAESGQRALGAIIAKYKKLHGLGYTSYTKLYNACVKPILDYGSGVWGSKQFGKIDTVQNRAIRVYLGVHAFAPNAAITADIGWTSSHIRRKIEMLRLWNRMVKLDNNRVTKQIFEWDYSLKRNNWCSKVRNILESIGMENAFLNKECVNLNMAWSKLYEMCCNEWVNNVQNYPKLRTYVQYKSDVGLEPYVSKLLSVRQRSVMARFRCGILPLEIEIRRYQTDQNRHRDICKICNKNVLEDELHFFFECDKYNIPRLLLFQNITKKVSNFRQFTNVEKLQILMNELNVHDTCKYLCDIYKIRQEIMYNDNV